ncbi:MAG: tRNA (adenosine(37)-N6)-threonylcarbamoyltransferase complex ATPase subunit type 1 TsaE [Candidatus Vogelbacteria bacterium]|nr:tRNA (adenosine(37)-N6)-threonylcarbamoyltransferase complex ATPase subunit type 1 TsaE [Candidatus Vogelbacteria bacterium]
MPLAKSLAETAKLAAEFTAALRPSEVGATIVGLYGDLGSGKTVFAQAVAKQLGVNEVVTSPTFVIEKVYRLPGEAKWWRHLIHIDAYRLKNVSEMLDLGWTEIAGDVSNLILIEWADRIEKILPPQTRKIFFKFIDETTREIRVA